MTDIGVDDEDASEWNESDDVSYVPEHVIKKLLTGYHSWTWMRVT
jgi:hypothetical protein